MSVDKTVTCIVTPFLNSIEKYYKLLKDEFLRRCLDNSSTVLAITVSLSFHRN